MTASPATGQQQSTYEQALNVLTDVPSPPYMWTGLNYLKPLRERMWQEAEAEKAGITLEELHRRKEESIRARPPGGKRGEAHVPEIIERYRKMTSDDLLNERKATFETSLREALDERGLSLSGEDFTRLSKEILNRTARAFSIQAVRRPENGVNGSNGVGR